MSRIQTFRTKALREMLRLLKTEGVKVLAVDVARRRRHYKLTIATPAGPRTIFMSSSPSDWRARRNVLADAKRLL